MVYKWFESSICNFIRLAFQNISNIEKSEIWVFSHFLAENCVASRDWVDFEHDYVFYCSVGRPHRLSSHD